MEYLQWCEDMSLEPILDVWAGLGLAGLPPLVGDELEPYVDDAVREIEVCCLPPYVTTHQDVVLKNVLVRHW